MYWSSVYIYKRTAANDIVIFYIQTVNMHIQHNRIKTAFVIHTCTFPIDTTCLQISCVRENKRLYLFLPKTIPVKTAASDCVILGLTAPVRCPWYPSLKRFINERREERREALERALRKRQRTHTCARLHTRAHCWKSAALEYSARSATSRSSRPINARYENNAALSRARIRGGTREPVQLTAVRCVYFCHVNMYFSCRSSAFQEHHSSWMQLEGP